MSDLYQIKVVKNLKYSVMDSTAVEDPRLSYRAKGIFWYLMSRPNGWVVQPVDLIKRSTEGRDAVRTGLKELETTGYLIRTTSRNKGRFSTEYHIYDQPLDRDGFPGPVDQSHQDGLSGDGLSGDGFPGDLEVNNENITSKSKHLGKAGSGDPEGAGTPVDMNPHKRQEGELDTKNNNALAKASDIPKTYQPILDAWANVAIRHQPGTKTMAKIKTQIRKARTGTLFKDVIEFQDECRPFTVQNIITAIERFGLQRNDPDYLPEEKKWLKEVSLDQFFYNKFSNGNKSWFAVSIRNGLQLASDHKPELTEFFAEIYNEKKGGQLDPDTAARIAAKLNRYWKVNESHLKAQGMATQKRLMIRWLSFLDTDIPDWGPQHFLAAGIDAQFEKYVRS